MSYMYISEKKKNLAPLSPPLQPLWTHPQENYRKIVLK